MPSPILPVAQPTVMHQAVRTALGNRRLVLVLMAMFAIFSLFYLATPANLSLRESLQKYNSCPEMTASTPRYNASKLAVLVEQRPLSTMIPILLHYMATMADDWPFQVFHTKENAHLFETSAAIRRYIKMGKLQTTLMPEDIILKTQQDVSAFLTKRWLWEQFEAEHIFFFQLDAIICSNSDMTVDDFLGYDWIGAPWPHFIDVKGGNGGLSLRRRSRLLRCLDKQTWQPTDLPEDVWFSVCLMSFPDAVMPSFEESKRFSLEGARTDRFLGVHKPYNDIQISETYATCPEARLLFLD
ncbi:hypothetical protein SpCBS45565_g03657 [Spizellomyces sp. 'palustris']|nr:hypothetical protein SpCBS45565_g03657 [Spizellomyces sp. 'palustris']